MPMKLRNPFTRPGAWYKANLHAHTTTSDGLVPPAELADMYRAAGYHVLAVTDHRKTNDLAGLSRKNFLVVSGMEYHPLCPTSPAHHHLVAINVPHGFALSARQLAPGAGNAAIRAVRAAGGETILAHPLWCGHRWDMYSYLKDYVAVEVFNTTCDRVGRAASEADWAHHLDAGRFLPAVAVDDCHRDENDFFAGWTWLRLPRLSTPAVMAALRSGCYYASTGPKIHDFRVRLGLAEVRCSPAESIYFMAQASAGARRKAPPGKSIRTFSHLVPPGWQYVRAVVVDHDGKKAWTNPIVL